MLCDQCCEECKYSHPSLFITPAVAGGRGSAVVIHNSSPGQVSGCWKKALCHISIMTLNVQSLAGGVEMDWDWVFCPQAEILAHLFVQCPCLGNLLELLKTWFQGLRQVFFFWSVKTSPLLSSPLLSSPLVYKLFFFPFLLHVDFKALSPCPLLPGRGTQDEEKHERSVICLYASLKYFKAVWLKEKAKIHQGEKENKGNCITSWNCIWDCNGARA